MAIRVQTIGVGSGTSADLTDSISALSWSSVNPGGDERATFSLKRQWFSGAPEIHQGNILRITDGPNVLWMGRIEENDRAVSDSEMIGVTAYGLGIRLKDTLKTEIYVDRDPGQWGPPPFNRQAAFGTNYDFASLAFSTDAGGIMAAIPTSGLTAQMIAEAWYTAPTGVTIGKIGYKGATTSLPSGWTFGLYSGVSDSASDADLSATFDDALHTAALGTARRWAFFQLYSNASGATTATKGSNARADVIAVYGNHGLTTRTIDASTPGGLYVEDIVSDAVSDASGITLARLDATGEIIPHCTFPTPTSLEDIVAFVNQFAGFDWGTFGASSVLDTSTNGYFQYTARDIATQHWFARRSECDDIALQVELASLYDSVDVVYTDPKTPGNQIATSTATVAALADAGISRKATLNGGTLTPAGAQLLGDTFLALTSQQPPARGSVKFSADVVHYRRGALPAYYMRADGSNLRLPDVLPSKDALSLSAAPDRRTTFPIKRVSVDCSGTVPTTTVEVDQADDRISILQARLGLAAQYPGAWPITLPNG